MTEKIADLVIGHCGMLMIAENVSVGILSLPSAVATLGMAPYVVCLNLHGTLANIHIVLLS